MQGTPNWMAPEVAKSQPSSRFSDIWSIGCWIIEMFEGKPLFYEFSNAFSVINHLCNLKDSPKIPENMSENLKQFVKKCLVIDPKKRFNVYQLKRHPFLKEDSNGDNKNYEFVTENKKLVEVKENNSIKNIRRSKLLECSNDNNYGNNIDSIKNLKNTENTTTNINDNNDNSLEINEKTINKKKKSQVKIENNDDSIKKDGK